MCDNNNNNGYFKVLFLRRAHSPFIKNINMIEKMLSFTNGGFCGMHPYL